MVAEHVSLPTANICQGPIAVEREGLFFQRIIHYFQHHCFELSRSIKSVCSSIVLSLRWAAIADGDAFQQKPPPGSEMTLAGKGASNRQQQQRITRNARSTWDSSFTCDIDLLKT